MADVLCTQIRCANFKNHFISVLSLTILTYINFCLAVHTNMKYCSHSFNVYISLFGWHPKIITCNPTELHVINPKYRNTIFLQ